MALIKCPECGHDVSDKAKSCIHCGCPLEIQDCEETSKTPASQEETDAKKVAITEEISDKQLTCSETGEKSDIHEEKVVSDSSEKNKRNWAHKAKEIFQSGNKKKAIISLAISIVLICAAAVVLSFFLNPKIIAKRYCKADILGNQSVMNSLTAYNLAADMISEYDDEEEFFEEAGNIFDEEISSWKDYSRALMSELEDEYEYLYGKFKLTQNVTKVNNLSNKKLLSKVNLNFAKLSNKYDFDINEVKKGKEIVVKQKIEGADDSDKWVYTVYLVKVGWTWKVLDYDFE